MVSLARVQRIEITWDAVPGATKYIVILSRFDGTVVRQAVKGTTAEFMTDPENVRKVRVQPNVLGAPALYFRL